jgi:hypothetical protein
MSTAIDAQNKTVYTNTERGDQKDDPTKDCCSAPPDTDPGPIKP